MAQLKSTSVTGNLSVTGNVVASKIIKNGGSEDQILLANGDTTSLDDIKDDINNVATRVDNLTYATLPGAKDIYYTSDSGYSSLSIGKDSGNGIYSLWRGSTNLTNIMPNLSNTGTNTNPTQITLPASSGTLARTSGDPLAVTSLTISPSSFVNGTEMYDKILMASDTGLIGYRTKRELVTDLNLAYVYNYKGELANINALKAITSAVVGDVYFLSDTGNSWACKQNVTSATGNNYTTYWSDLGKNIDLSGYMTLNTNQTITGVKTFTNNLLLTENSSSIITRSAGDAWTAGIYSNTSGDEVLGILVKNPKTHIMLGLGDVKARPAATDLTPAIDIKNSKVGINKRLGEDGSDKAGNYNLDVNGSLNTVSMTLDTSATFTYNSTDKCIDILFN